MSSAAVGGDHKMITKMLASIGGITKSHKICGHCCCRQKWHLPLVVVILTLTVRFADAVSTAAIGMENNISLISNHVTYCTATIAFLENKLLSWREKQ